MAVVRVTAIYFVEKNYVDTSTTRFLKKCHLSSRKILDLLSNKKYIFWNLHKGRKVTVNLNLKCLDKSAKDDYSGMSDED